MNLQLDNVVDQFNELNNVTEYNKRLLKLMLIEDNLKRVRQIARQSSTNTLQHGEQITQLFNRLKQEYAAINQERAQIEYNARQPKLDETVGKLQMVLEEDEETPTISTSKFNLVHQSQTAITKQKENRKRYCRYACVCLLLISLGLTVGLTTILLRIYR